MFGHEVSSGAREGGHVWQKWSWGSAAELQPSGTTLHPHVLAVYCNTCQNKSKMRGEKKGKQTPNLTVKRLIYLSKKKNELEEN